MTTASPAFQRVWVLWITLPAASMPATIGHLRTTGDVFVSASPSL